MSTEDSERLECLAWAIEKGEEWKGSLMEDDEIQEFEHGIEKAREAFTILKNFLEAT